VKRFFIVLFSAVLVAHWGLCLAEVTVVKAEGSTRRLEDESATKIRARDNALNNAISSVLASFMSEESIKQYSEETDELVNQKTSVYLLNYRILKEGWIIHHDEPNKAEGQEVLLEEPLPEESPSSSWETLLPAEKPVTGVEFYHIWIEAKVDVGQLREDTRHLTGYGVEGTRSVTILILDVLDHTTYESIKNRLEQIDIIRDISYNSFFSGRIVLTAEVQGTAHTLWEKLENEVGDDFVLIPSGKDKLIIKAPGEADRFDDY
jgi:hypothetical protein